MTVHVFVYGTLTDPARVHDVLGLENATQNDRSSSDVFDGPAVLEGLHRVDGEYPTLAPGGRTEGRLLAADDAILERLDRYEGVESGLYTRVSISTEGLEGPVDVYVGDPDRLGVAADCGWPAGDSFTSQVQTACERREIYVRRPE